MLHFPSNMRKQKPMRNRCFKKKNGSIFVNKSSFLCILFIYLFLAVLGFLCCTWTFSSCKEQGLLFIAADMKHKLQIPLASLIAQLVKNPPAMQETLVRFLGQEDPLEKG